ncbi:MAG TPA: RNA polymerase sigma factor [Candidatus Saccharimonadia bacterium]|nr:RNA polymerase sigma factor [Candidatus Saccharimonadia bacterium]
MLNEQELIARAQADPPAFGELYDQTYPKISNYILRRVGEVAVAQDLTAEVYIKAMRGLPRYQWRGLPFTAWLYRIAANEIAGYFRRQHHGLLSLEALYEEHQFEPAAELDLERELIERQQQAERYADFRLVRDLLQRLPAKYQEVLALRYFEQQPLADIVIITGKNLNTVKSLLMRGLQRLRTEYNTAKTATQTQPLAPSRVIEAEE